MSLDEIGKRHGTDKASTYHNYLRLYETYFSKWRGEAINILEIGVQSGASLRAWCEYFPKASVWGVDKDQSAIQNVPVGAHGICGNTNDLSVWNSLTGRAFDIIIDDGDHSAESQEHCFRCGFPLLKAHGIYIIEDIHDNQGRILGRLVPMLSDLNDEWTSGCGNPDLGHSELLFVHFWKSLIMIGKK